MDRSAFIIGLEGTECFSEGRGLSFVSKRSIGTGAANLAQLFTVTRRLDASSRPNRPTNPTAFEVEHFYVVDWLQSIVVKREGVVVDICTHLCCCV